MLLTYNADVITMDHQLQEVIKAINKLNTPNEPINAVIERQGYSKRSIEISLPDSCTHNDALALGGLIGQMLAPR